MGELDEEADSEGLGVVDSLAGVGVYLQWRRWAVVTRPVPTVVRSMARVEAKETPKGILET